MLNKSDKSNQKKQNQDELSDFKDKLDYCESLISQKLFFNALRIYEEINSKIDSIEIQRNIADIYEKIDVRIMHDNENYLIKAIQCREDIVAKTNEIQDYCYLALAYYKNYIYFRKMDSYNKMLDILTKYYSPDNDFESCFLIASTYNSIAYEAHIVKNPLAKKYLQKALEILSLCEKKTDDDDKKLKVYKEKCITYTYLYDFYFAKNGNFELTCLKVQVSIKKKIFKKYTTQEQTEIINHYIYKADLYQWRYKEEHKKEQLEMADFLLLSSLYFLKNLSPDENSERYINDRKLYIYLKYSTLKAAKRDYFQSEKYYNKTIVLLKSNEKYFRETLSDTKYFSTLQSLYTKLLTCKLRENDTKKVKSYKKKIEILDNEIKKAKNNQNNQLNNDSDAEFEYLINSTDLLFSCELYSEVIDGYKKILTYSSKLINNIGLQTKIFQNLGLAYYHIGDNENSKHYFTLLLSSEPEFSSCSSIKQIIQPLQNLYQYDDDYLKIKYIYKKLLFELNKLNPLNKNILTNSQEIIVWYYIEKEIYLKFIELSQMDNKLSEEIEFYKAIVSISKETFTKYPEKEFILDYTNFTNYLYTLLLKNNQPEKVKEYLIKPCELLEKYNLDAEINFTLLNQYFLIGKDLYNDGSVSEAETWFEKIKSNILQNLSNEMHFDKPDSLIDILKQTADLFTANNNSIAASEYLSLGKQLQDYFKQDNRTFYTVPISIEEINKLLESYAQESSLSTSLMELESVSFDVIDGNKNDTKETYDFSQDEIDDIIEEYFKNRKFKPKVTKNLTQDEIDAIVTEHLKSLEVKPKEAKDLTQEEIDKIVNEHLKSIEVKPKEPEDLTQEEIDAIVAGHLKSIEVKPKEAKDLSQDEIDAIVSEYAKTTVDSQESKDLTQDEIDAIINEHLKSIEVKPKEPEDLTQEEIDAIVAGHLKSIEVKPKEAKDLTQEEIDAIVNEHLKSIEVKPKEPKDLSQAEIDAIVAEHQKDDDVKTIKSEDLTQDEIDAIVAEHVKSLQEKKKSVLIPSKKDLLTQLKAPISKTNNSMEAEELKLLSSKKIIR